MPGYKQAAGNKVRDMTLSSNSRANPNLSEIRDARARLWLARKNQMSD